MLSRKLGLGASARFSLILSAKTASIFVISFVGSNVAISSWVGASSAFCNAAGSFSF